MYLLLLAALLQPLPWQMVVGRQQGEFVVWTVHKYETSEECQEDLMVVAMTNPVEAYCERALLVA